MTYKDAKNLAKEIASRHGLIAYIHTSPSTGFNFRFVEPIETVDKSCKTVASFDPRNGQWTIPLTKHKRKILRSVLKTSPALDPFWAR